MNFRKYTYILALLIFSTVAFNASAEFRWGPQIGLNGSGFYWKQKLVTSRYALGPTAGIMGEVMIPGIGFGIDMGLRYQMNGAKVNFGERYIWSSPPENLGNEKVLMHTLQIPVNLRFKWTRLDGLERIVAPFAYAGPVFTFNLTDNKCSAIEYPEGTVDIQIGAGAELFEHLQISGGYYWGVSYQVRTIKLDNFSARPQGWFVNAAWLF